MDCTDSNGRGAPAQPMFLRTREVAQLIGLKPQAIDREIRAGRFPRPFRIGVKTKAWDFEEIREWKRQRDTERDSYADPARPFAAEA